MKKKMLNISIIMAAIIFSAASLFYTMPVYAAGDFTVKNGVLEKYTGVGGSVTIPENITEIGAGAFSERNVTSVVLSDSVNQVDSGAFGGCTSLKSVSVPQSTAQFQSSVFSGCTSLESIEIPNAAQIDKDAFKDCSSLKTVKLSKNLSKISDGVFSGCSSLSEIELPENISQIGENAFKGCSSLKKIKIPQSTAQVCSSAFENCVSLEKAVVSNSVSQLGDRCFAGCVSLKTAVLPTSISQFGSDVFSDCKNLTVFGEKGSPAQLYAQKNGITFKPESSAELEKEMGSTAELSSASAASSAAPVSSQRQITAQSSAAAQPAASTAKPDQSGKDSVPWIIAAVIILIFTTATIVTVRGRKSDIKNVPQGDEPTQPINISSEKDVQKNESPNENNKK